MRTFLHGTIATAFGVTAAGVVALAGVVSAETLQPLHAIGHEFRPSPAMQGYEDYCVESDGAVPELTCSAPDQYGHCSGIGDLLLQWRDAGGEVVAGPFQVNEEPVYFSRYRICTGDGSVVIPIARNSLRVFDRGGPRGPIQYLCGADENCNAYGDAAAAIGDGFVMLQREGWPSELQARFFSAAGTPSGPPFLVVGASHAAPVGDVAAVPTLDGRALVVWSVGNGYSGRGVYAALLDAGGGVDETVTVSEFAKGRFSIESVRRLGRALFVVTWDNYDTQEGSIGRYLRITDEPAPPPTTTTTTLPPGAPVFLPTSIADEIWSYDAGAPGFELSLASDGDGRWVGSWYDLYDSPLHVPEEWGPVVASSADGREWSAPLPVADAGGLEERGVAVGASVTGTVVAAWGSPYSTVAVHFRRSGDGGRTWSASDVLYEQPGALDHSWVEHVRLKDAGSGRWIAAWWEHLDSYEEAPYADFCGVRVAVSHDDARSWTVIAAVADALYCTEIFDLAIGTDRRDAAVVAWVHSHTSDVWGTYSTDGLATWSPAARLVSTDDARPSSLDVGSDAVGNWLLVWSADPSHDGTPTLFSSRTRDPGAAWSAPMPVAAWHAQQGTSDHGPSLASAGQGRWGLVWSTSSEAAGLGMDSDIVAAWSRDNGRTWTRPSAVDRQAGHDAGTDRDPQIAFGGNDTWGVLWRSYEQSYFDGEWDSSIRFARTRGSCGDGRVDADEDCDDGNAVDGDGCDTNCIATSCGNRIVTAGEECDDGNEDDSDDCVSTCRRARCGDGVAHAQLEQCDDGNDDDHDACLTGCIAATCGDGIVQEGVEECEELAEDRLNNNDSCISNCMTAACGDGFRRDGVEECDDGNRKNGDRCTRDCRIDPVCSDSDRRQPPAATLALRGLQKAVGLAVRCPAKVCDADRNGRITAADASLMLRRSVGLSLEPCDAIQHFRVRIDSETRIGALQLLIDYGDTVGDIVVSDDQPACEVLPGQLLSAMNLTPWLGKLRMGFVSLDGFEGPTDLVRCEIRSEKIPLPEDFEITVEDASDPEFDPLEGLELSVVVE